MTTIVTKNDENVNEIPSNSVETEQSIYTGMTAHANIPQSTAIQCFWK